MKTLLRIDASTRTTNSWSRELADYFVEQWRNTYPSGSVIYRDLAKQTLPHLVEATIVGFYTSAEGQTRETAAAVALSDELIAELKSADVVLISSPMYNYNLPSTLKAYIDHVFRINHTFHYSQGVCQGLLANKRAYVITAKGSELKGTPMETYDFQDPYLKVVLTMMGMQVEPLFSLESTSNREIALNNWQEILQRIRSVFIHSDTAAVTSTHQQPPGTRKGAF
jgi:FMN-dependent NADH-azoreductase